MNKILALSCAAAFALTACQSDSKFGQDEKAENQNTEATHGFDLANLDTTVAPCDNFYQYAIGGWLKNNPVPSTESRWSSFNVVNDSNNLKLRKILEDYSSKDNEAGSMEQKIGDFYKSIMDSTHAEDLGYTPIQAELEKIEALTNTSDLVKLLAHHKSIGVNSLFSIYVGQDDKNSEQYITHLSQSGLGLPDRDYYTKSDQKSKKIQQAYQAHIGKMFALLEAENSNVLAKKVYSIEKTLAEASMTRVERRDPDKTYNKMSVAKLESEFANISWDTYFDQVGVKNIDHVIVSQPYFLKVAAEQLKIVSIEDWKVYLKWRLIDTYASELSSDFVNQNFDFYGKTLSGTKEMKPRWERALSKINGNIGQLLGKAFVDRHFSKEAKEEVSRMVENLRAVFRTRIQNLEWMTEETKVKAIEKLESFNKKIGYPDKWRDFSDLEIVADNQVKNIMNSRQFNFAYMINKLGKPIDQDEWFMSPQTVNAYYSSSKNEIVFPAGILQPPFYSVSADAALNYGGIGAVIGHEFTHGFDDQGSKYDAKGNLQNWWTEEDRTSFDARAQKVVDQFDGFEVLDSVFVNGKLTLGENIADLGGATLAYHALEKELEKNGKPDKIDGFTYQQRFFLGWAQVWHMNMTEEELRKRIATDPHSPGEYRVIGPLANMPEFAEAFDCKEGDPMVNSDTSKAIIW
ncbi:MAG: M13 family metallopeptidase [Vicingaceae bacterium]